MKITLLHAIKRKTALGIALLLAGTTPVAAEAAQILTPSINISSRVVSDGVSVSNPKAIPSAIFEYEMTVANIPTNSTSQDGPVIANPVPDQLSLYVGDIGNYGSGPFIYEAASAGSGFECSFSSLSNMSDCVEFSDNGGSSFDYVPMPDRQGFDSNITHVRFRLKPGLQASQTATSTFVLRYRMRME